MLNKCLSGWKCCIVPKTTGQFQQSKVYKTSISPHVFLNRATHSAQNKHVFFPYVHIWPYKKLQTKPVAHDFDETFLRSVSLVTALILKQSNFCYVELNSSMQLRVFGRLVLPPMLTAHLESLTSSKTQIGCWNANLVSTLGVTPPLSCLLKNPSYTPASSLLCW